MAFERAKGNFFVMFNRSSTKPCLHLISRHKQLCFFFAALKVVAGTDINDR
jgi:hypothetical protein